MKAVVWKAETDLDNHSTNLLSARSLKTSAPELECFEAACTY